MKSTSTPGLRSIILILASVFFLTSCDRNEFPPEMADQEFSIDENSPKGSIIGAISAVDLDENSVLSFSIIEGNSNNEIALDERTGILTVNDPAKFDFEKTKEFTLNVRVSDNHQNDPLESESIIKIFLNDVNEFAPEVSDQLFQVEEFSPEGTFIGQILATDQDKEQSLIYTIASGNDDGILVMDSLTGEVYVGDSLLLDYDVQQSVKCMISVTDDHAGSPRTTNALLTIEILEGEAPVYSIKGNVQKGPFIQGSVITVSELNAFMEPTGRTFQTTIDNNSGSFSLSDIALESSYVKIKADGFYFNERSGALSEAQLTLQAISNVTDSSTINVNLLTHMEMGRIETLIDQGETYEDAKHQAQQEVLNIFTVLLPDIHESELLDISQANDENAALLAISVIVQGFRTTAEFTELLSTIIQDIKDDGTLDNEEIQSKLINHAYLLSTSEIRSNLESRYSDLGVSAVIPEFEKYLTSFIEESGYEITSGITYLRDGSFGENILFKDSINYKSDVKYSMAANLPVGTNLKIRLSGGNWSYVAMPVPPKNWQASAYNRDTKSMTFTAIESGVDCDLEISFREPTIFYDSINPPYLINDYIKVEYFENLSETPVFEKTIALDKD